MRLPTGGRIDRARPIRFTFDGREYWGFSGDTLASALVANDVAIVGRSFKYHRPRGILAAGEDEPNAIVAVDGEPNLRATTVELYDGLAATSVNRWPSLRFDLGAAADLAHRFLPAGFYYKTFMRWPLWEPFIRRAAGLGRAPDGPDPSSYLKRHAHCDVLVVGGGAAGVEAARAAAATGARVMLANSGLPSPIEGVTVLRRTTVVGYYDHNQLAAVERVADHLPPSARKGLPRQRIWHIRAGRVVLATGAIERPLVFPGNDRPGVMLASAASRYASEWAALAGSLAVVVTNNDTAYAAAAELRALGMEIAAIVDVRGDPAALADVPVHAHAEIVATRGRRRVRAVRLSTGAEIECDTVLMSGGWNPAVHLFSQSGGKLRWDERRACFVPDRATQNVVCIGAAAGDFSEPRIAPHWRSAGAGRQWVDLQSDVTVADVELAVREKFSSVEHFKRYTTTGMSTDQGKTSNVNALALLGELTGRAPEAVGTTTFRGGVETRSLRVRTPVRNLASGAVRKLGVVSGPSNELVVSGAREHNLKDIDVRLPRNALVVITGLSGSGKSSLAFDTIYAEGQRRYVESLSAYARQFLGQMDKPDVDSIEGLSPAISIDQKTTSRNPRSTVGTVTEIYDYLRLLWARIGQPHCYNCGRPIAAQSAEQIVDQVMTFEEGTRFMVEAPVIRGRKGEYGKLFEELRAEGYTRVKVNGELRRLEEEFDLDKRYKHDISVVVDRLVMRPDLRKRLTDSIETAVGLAEGLVDLELVDTGEVKTFSERFACLHCGTSMPELEPRIFSFNSPHGACPRCTGLGSQMEIDPELIVPDPSLSLAEGAILPWSTSASNYYEQMTAAIADKWEVDLDTPWEDLDEEVRDTFLFGTDGERIYVSYKNRYGRKRSYMTRFEGIVHNLERRYRETDSEWSRDKIEEYMSVRPCPECHGSRLRPESLAVKLGGLGIDQLTSMSARRTIEWFDALELTDTERAIARLILREIDERLRFLDNVGVGYLSLERAAATLSGGEAQRIRLATQIGSSLVGVLYILDEPSIGLHQRDNERLIATLERLRDLGNTVIVVEHDEGTMRAADHIVDMGPGAGEHGGAVVAEGTVDVIEQIPGSLTGQYLSGAVEIPVPPKRRRPQGYLEIEGAAQNNLQRVNAKIPLGTFTAVTGVSGSGKSTLVNEVLYKAVANRLHRAKTRPGAHKRISGLDQVDKIINIDQSPIGRTPRSNPATYIGVFDAIRDLFSRTQEARARGYKPGRFSFNVKGGRCEVCRGDGQIKIEMHFLPDVYVPCEQCDGKRYNRETLEVRFKGRTIADVLDMTVEEAVDFFQHIPKIKRKMQALHDVGLDYVRLGQPATTLSGGEAQRVKLASELSKVATGRTLYILDEPTTGLHFADVQRLLDMLQRLVDSGNTVVVIEHNLDVIKTADRIIDMGPEGGEEGGTIVAQGTPEQVAAKEGSYTGRFLADIVEPKRSKRRPQVAAAA